MTDSVVSADAIVRIGKMMYNRQFIAGTDGNISVRLDDDRILITPAGYRKGEMTVEDLVVIDYDGKKISGANQPSSEMGMHIRLYQDRSDISACVHAHPPYATSFAVTNQSLNEPVLPEIELFVGPVAMTSYSPPGTDAVADELHKYSADHNAFLLKNHGLVTVGKDINQAFNRLETVEQLARIIWLAKQIGTVDSLDQKEIERLAELRHIIG